MLLQALALRGTEADAELVRQLACSTRFWSASAPEREATLRAEADVPRLLREYAWEELPTAWLRTWATPATLQALSARKLPDSRRAS